MVEQMSEYRILQGDCLATLKTLESESVQCVVSSPPYYGLRDYGVDGQIGLEQSPEEYIAKLVAVFREVRRVMKDDSTLWLNLGDSFASSGIKFTGRNDPEKYGNDAGGRTAAGGCSNLKPKDLMMIPARVALALQADGWWLRSDIIWDKPQCMPESCTDRPTKSHEHIFLLAKSSKYYYDHIAILEPAAFDGRKDTQFKGSKKLDTGYVNTIARIGGERWPNKLAREGTNTQGHSGNFNADGEPNITFNKDGVPARNKRDVWRVNTAQYKEAHFAVFPEKLIEPCILAGTSEKGECPKCGKAWERVVERQNKSTWQERKEHGATGGCMEKGGAQQTGTYRQGNYKDLPARENITTGWQPQCECGEQPVPQKVLDPFAGSGTTLAVSIKNGRDAIGCELNPAYIKLIEKRLAQVQPRLLDGML
jgi:DNA modification methylase